MPQTFENIANTLGDATKVTTHTPGGTGFANHVSNPTVYQLFSQGIWDVVILQPGTGDSAGASFGGSSRETSVERIKLLRDSIYQHNPCCKILFYEISNGVYGNTPDNLNSYNTVMDTIRSNIEYFSESTQIPFAPVGEAFRKQWNSDLNTMLWGSVGDVHPNAYGSYLASCVFYASIFQKPSLGTAYLAGLPIDDAKHFQKVADNLVLGNLAEWNINTFELKADFEFIQEDTVFVFNNLSQNTDSLLWSFGDGETSLEFNPEHTFASYGTYNVSLKAYKNGCSQVITKSVDYIYNSIRNVSNQKFSVYPNPALKGENIQVNLNFEARNTPLKAQMFNSLGKVVFEQKAESSRFNLSSSKLKRGVYVLKIGDVSKKVVIN